MIEIVEEADFTTSFEQKYIFTEAKGKPRTNLRRISVTMKNGKSGLTVNGKEIPNDDIPIDDDDSDDSVDIDALDSIDVDDDDTGDESSDDDVVTEPDDDSSEDNVDTDEEDDVLTDDSDDSGDDSSEDDEVMTDDSDDDDGSGANSDEESTGDDVLTDDSEDESPTDNSGEDTSGGDQNMGDDSGDESNMSPEQKEEAIHKQALYRQFNLLYTTIGKYIQKLEEQTGLDDTLNHSINKVTDQLTSLQEFLYDYMVIKFKNEEYVKSVLFYERSVAVVSLCMDILDDIKKSRNRLLVKKKSNRKQ